jgi:hypothetical protein
MWRVRIEGIDFSGFVVCFVCLITVNGREWGFDVGGKGLGNWNFHDDD